MFKSIKPKSRIKVKVRSIFAPSIPYEIRNKSGDWSRYFGQYESQKKDWWDTDSCWSYAGNEVLEDQLEFLMTEGYFKPVDIQWFKDNGYIDEDGDFYLSRRYIPIISGAERNGNDQAEFWRLTKKYGAIPSKLLPFTTIDEYFDQSKITPIMFSLGKQFLTKVKIAYLEVGTRHERKNMDELKSALFQEELQIGIPVPDYAIWNSGKVTWDGTMQAVHSVALYKIDEAADYNFPYFIYDQYEPHLKQLARDYFIPICTRAVVTPNVPAIVNPVSQLTLGAQIWRAIWDYFTS